MKTKKEFSVKQINRSIGPITICCHSVLLTLLLTATQTYLLAQGQAGSARSQYVQQASLWPELRDSISKLGQHLQRPGKERIVLNGSLYRAWSSQNVNVRILWELPGKIRVEELAGGSPEVSVSNGSFFQKSGGRALTSRDNDMLETLVYDSAERFFISQAEGMSILSHGARFRDLDAPATVFYDIYEVVDQVKRSQGSRLQRKLYYINSDTRFLEKVFYTIRRGGSPINVEVKLTDWQNVNGESVPGKIERYEDNQLVLSLVINGSGTGPSQSDGMFDHP